MKRFKKSERASVSIFLMIIIVAVFLFNAVLIDFSRILVAEKQTERAMKAAIRSVMSSFDTALQSEYGLYGFSGDENGLFKEVVSKNLSIDSDDYFQFVDTAIDEDSISITSPDSFSLGNKEVLKEQITQEMKYRAPITFLMEVTNTLSQASGAMKEASDFVNTVADLEGPYNNREAKIDSVIAELNQSNNGIAGLNGDINGSASSPFGTIMNLKDIEAQYSQFKADYDAAKAKEDEAPDGDDAESEEEEEEVDDTYLDYYSNGKSYLANLESDISAIETNLQDAYNAVNAAIGYNNEMANIIETNKSERQQYNSLDQGGDDTFSDAKNTIREETDGLDKMLYTDELTSLRVRITGAQEKVKELRDLLKAYRASFTSDVKLASAKPPATSAIKQAFSESKTAVQNAASLANGNWRKKGKGEEKFKNKEGDLVSAEEEAARVEDMFKQTPSKSGGAYQKEMEMYEDLEKFYGSLAEFNRLIEVDGSSESSKEMMGVMDDLFSSLANIVEGARDELYINEYIMTHFVSQEPYSLADTESFLLKNKEVEYLLYGIHEPYLNYSAAVAQIFALRFAARIIDFFANPSVPKPPEPISLLIAATIYALGYAGADMVQITNGEAVALISDNLTPGLKLDYRDYLRIMLFINPGKEEKLMRIQALINNKTNIDLKERPTYLEAEATSTVKLWFLPGIAKMLNKAGILDGKVVDGNRYQIKKKAGFSY